MPLLNIVVQRHFLYEQAQKGTISEYIKYNYLPIQQRNYPFHYGLPFNKSCNKQVFKIKIAIFAMK